MSCDEAERSVPVAPPVKPTYERKEPVLSRPEGRKSDDMKDEMQKPLIFAIAVDVIPAFEKNSVGKAVADHIRKEFDKKHMVLLGNCIVGRNFGSYVTHEMNHCVFLLGSESYFTV